MKQYYKLIIPKHTPLYPTVWHVYYNDFAYRKEAKRIYNNGAIFYGEKKHIPNSNGSPIEVLVVDNMTGSPYTTQSFTGYITPTGAFWPIKKMVSDFKGEDTDLTNSTNFK
jgi:hypothetical protein